MSNMMNAINVTAFGDANSLQVSQVPIPIPKTNEVLIRNHAIGVNFVDTQHRAGKPYPVDLPIILGIEAAGEGDEPAASRVRRMQYGRSSGAARGAMPGAVP